MRQMKSLVLSAQVIIYAWKTWRIAIIFQMILFGFTEKPPELPKFVFTVDYSSLSAIKCKSLRSVGKICTPSLSGINLFRIEGGKTDSSVMFPHFQGIRILCSRRFSKWVFKFSFNSILKHDHSAGLGQQLWDCVSWPRPIIFVTIVLDYFTNWNFG